jgi:ACS family tartrate transporter-like MFS transporter
MVAAAGIKSYQPPFWALPSLLLTEAAAAGSIGLINSVGNLGGFVGPYMMGWVEKTTGSFAGGLSVLAVSLMASALIVLFLGLGRKSEPA